jgi:spore germination protein YaaH
MNLRLTIRILHKNKLSKKHITNARMEIDKKGIKIDKKGIKIDKEAINLTIGKI